MNEELSPYQKKLLSNQKSFYKIYHNNEDFRSKVIERSKENVYNKYHNDPEYRQKMIDRAKERYYVKKALKNATPIL